MDAMSSRVHTSTCARCGRAFESARKDALYCSTECYEAAEQEQVAALQYVTLADLLPRWEQLAIFARQRGEQHADSRMTAHFYGLANGLDVAAQDLRRALDALQADQTSEGETWTEET